MARGAMVCNLDQHPLKRPIVASWLPALLRQGTMFLMNLNNSEMPDENNRKEERWLLDVASWIATYYN